MKATGITKISGIILIVFLFNPTNSLAQDSTAHKSPVKRGKWALQFQIDKNFTLTYYSGTLISLQKTLSDKNAVRLGLNLNGNYNSVKRTDNQKGNSEEFHIGVSATYLWYIHANRKVRFYYGAGPSVGVSFNHSKLRGTTKSGTSVSENMNFSENAGIGGVAGVEWFVVPQISLMAEYNPSLMGIFNKQISKAYPSQLPNPELKTSTVTINLAETAVHFGVSVYF